MLNSVLSDSRVESSFSASEILDSRSAICFVTVVSLVSLPLNSFESCVRTAIFSESVESDLFCSIYFAESSSSFFSDISLWDSLVRFSSAFLRLFSASAFRLLALSRFSETGSILASSFVTSSQIFCCSESDFSNSSRDFFAFSAASWDSTKACSILIRDSFWLFN